MDRVADFTFSLCLEQGQGFVESAEPPIQIPAKYPLPSPPLPGTVWTRWRINTFIPKSDQVQISPVASPVILHHTVWRTWLFIAYSDWKMILVPVLTTSLIHFSWKGWENVLFELGIERVKERRPAVALTLSIPRGNKFEIRLHPHQKYYITQYTMKSLTFIAYSDERWLYYQFSLPRLYTTNSYYLNQYIYL